MRQFTKRAEGEKEDAEKKEIIKKSELILSVSFMVRFGSTLDLPHPKAPGGDFIKTEGLKQFLPAFSSSV